MYALIVLGACCVKQLDIVFSLINTIAINFVSFWFPALFYLAARRQHLDRMNNGNLKQEVDLKDGSLLLSVAVNLLLGVFSFFVGLYANIKSLTK
mmetsp:Transcript_325/g.591  ORF Transcript_325/g.591 Transcript_325/m.591 type:complete len:95 (-) Transcript_325:9-293(-)